MTLKIVLAILITAIVTSFLDNIYYQRVMKKVREEALHSVDVDDSEGKEEQRRIECGSD